MVFASIYVHMVEQSPQNGCCQSPFRRWFPVASFLSRSLLKISWYFCHGPNSKQSKNQRDGSLSYSPPDSNPPALKAKCSEGSSSWCGISRLWNPVCGMNSLLLGKKNLCNCDYPPICESPTCGVDFDYTSSPALLLDSYSFLVSLVVEYIFCVSTGCSLW